ncbi:MAG: LysM peptidoglycan-binding domain-containing protein [Akkermansiaceae bacterium]|nr:LysM peptidoglycan-binding domain-containing protein [Akkermansiaceae bacterium]
MSVDDLRTLVSSTPVRSIRQKFLMVPGCTSPASRPSKHVCRRRRTRGKNATPRKPARAAASRSRGSNGGGPHRPHRAQEAEPPQPVRQRKLRGAKGDTLFSISRFGAEMQDLMAMNGIDKPENLRAGQSLRVPKN